MTTFSKYSEEQYEHVRSSRNVLLEYCKTISTEDFVNQNTSFGRGGSMRNLLVHIANTYQYWIGNLVMKKNIVYSEYEENKTLSDVIKLFNEVDKFMDEFIKNIGSMFNTVGN